MYLADFQIWLMSLKSWKSYKRFFLQNGANLSLLNLELLWKIKEHAIRQSRWKKKIVIVTKIQYHCLQKN